MTKNNKITKVFKIFNPGIKFPSISITGNRCELDCAHCGGHYLKHMIEVGSPDDLVELCVKLDAENTDGALISGGCNSNGEVMLKPYLKAISEIKKRTKLILNIHTGFASKALVQQLVQTNIDVVSIDIVGDRTTIYNVYGLKHEPNEYKNRLLNMQGEGVKKIVPHICIGLNFGNITGEYNAINMLAGNNPGAIVFIILIPTKGTKMENCKPPEVKKVIDVIKYARLKFDKTPLYLGCMRPRAKKFRNYTQELEINAIKAGIDGIVLPSKRSLRFLQNLEQKHQIRIEKYDRCCAV